MKKATKKTNNQIDAHRVRLHQFINELLQNVLEN